MSKNRFKISVFIVILLAFLVLMKLHFLPFLSVDTLNTYFHIIQSYYYETPIFVSIVYVVLYILSNALPVPLMLFLTLFGGALFGPILAIPLVLISVTGAAVFSALISRFILRKHLEAAYSSRLETINKGLSSNGLGFLFSLRLVPIFPFFVVNFLLGLTRVPLYLIAITTCVGLAPSVIIYSYAGQHLTTIHSIHDAMSPKLLLLLLGFGVLAFLPSLIGWIRKGRQK